MLADFAWLMGIAVFWCVASFSLLSLALNVFSHSFLGFVFALNHLCDGDYSVSRIGEWCVPCLLPRRCADVAFSPSSQGSSLSGLDSMARVSICRASSTPSSGSFSPTLAQGAAADNLVAVLFFSSHMRRSATPFSFRYSSRSSVGPTPISRRMLCVLEVVSDSDRY